MYEMKLTKKGRLSRARKDIQIGGIHSVKFGTKKLQKYIIESLNNQYYYKTLYANEFIDFMDSKINKICEENIEFKNSLDYIKYSKKQEGVSVNKSDRSDKLKESYNIVKAVAKETGILNKYDNAKEFNKSCDDIYNLYLQDDVRSYTIDEKMSAYIKFFEDKDAQAVHKKRVRDTHCIQSKPEYTNGNHYTRAFSLKYENGYYYLYVRDCTNATMNRLRCKYYDEETHKLKCNLRYPKLKFRLYVNKKDDLQNIINRGDLTEILGGIKIERLSVRGKYRYYVDIAFMTQSPVYQNYSCGDLKVAINVQTQTRAIVRSDGSQEIVELAPNIKRVCDELKDVERYLDNSKRAMNPDLYLEDGQIKYTREQMQELGLKWRYSRRYKQSAKFKTEYYRQLTCKRKLSNNIQAKKDVQGANYVILDHNQFKAWGTKMTQMSKKSNEKYNNGVRIANSYAKHLQDRSPGYYTERVKHNCEQLGIELHEVAGFNTSTYNPFTQKNDIVEKLNNRSMVYGDSVDELLRYNPNAIKFIDTCMILEDEDNIKYFVQRDLFAGAKMLFLYPVVETRIDGNGKERKVIVYKIDNDAFIDWFKTVFYPKHIKYLQQLNEQQKLGLDINGTIFGN